MSLSPKSSPTTKKTGVRRVNDRPLYAIGAVLLAFVIFITLAAVERGEHSAQKESETPKATQGGGADGVANQLIENISGGLKGDIAPIVSPPAKVATAKPKVSPPPTGNAPMAKPQPVKVPPLRLPHLPENNRPGNSAGEEWAREMAAIRKARLAALEAASRAQTAVSVSGFYQQATHQPAGAASQSSAVAPGRNNSSVDQTLKLLHDRIEALGKTSRARQEGLLGSLAPFNSPQGDRWLLHSQLEPPLNAYELRAGYVIPAIMISGIDSDLPGEVIAQVSQNVFDTATGKYLLIPQGSRLVGSYSSSIGYGQKRVFVAWQRIIFPDGRALDIGAMPGADATGYGGMSDKVDTHFFRTLGSAILMSVIVGGIEYSQGVSNNSTTDRQSAADYMSQALGQQLGGTLSQMLSKDLNVSPTLEIRPGYRFNVMVIKDLDFASPYRPFDYEYRAAVNSAPFVGSGKDSQ